MGVIQVEILKAMGKGSHWAWTSSCESARRAVDRDFLSALFLERNKVLAMVGGTRMPCELIYKDSESAKGIHAKDWTFA
jgi:hypothetical protein